jgi:hypothetical protein
MLTCPKCHASVPEGMRFCLQCGAALVHNPSGAPPAVEADPLMPAAPVKASPVPPFTPLSTVNLRIAPTPVMSPRTAPRAQHPRPRLGDDIEEIDEEALKKSFERRVVRPGTVVCRFCKGPLDLGGEFCDQCGAPVAEAAPPGTLPVKTQPAAPPALLDDDPLSPLAAPAQAAPSTAGIVTEQHPGTTPPPPPGSSQQAEPAHYTPPVAPASPRTSPAEEPPSGLLGRFKGLFKKS